MDASAVKEQVVLHWNLLLIALVGKVSLLLSRAH